MKKVFGVYEYIVVFFKIFITIILLIVIFFLLVKLLIYLLEAIMISPGQRFTVANTETFLSDILLALVFIELFRTVYIYLIRKDIYLQALIEAALIAVLRKVLLLEVEKVEPLYMIALAVIIFTLFYIYFRFVEFTVQIRKIKEELKRA